MCVWGGELAGGGSGGGVGDGGEDTRIRPSRITLALTFTQCLGLGSVYWLVLEGFGACEVVGDCITDGEG